MIEDCELFLYFVRDVQRKASQAPVKKINDYSDAKSFHKTIRRLIVKTDRTKSKEDMPVHDTIKKEDPLQKCIAINRHSKNSMMHVLKRKASNNNEYNIEKAYEHKCMYCETRYTYKKCLKKHLNKNHLL